MRVKPAVVNGDPRSLTKTKHEGSLSRCSPREPTELASGTWHGAIDRSGRPSCRASARCQNPRGPLRHSPRRNFGSRRSRRFRPNAGGRRRWRRLNDLSAQNDGGMEAAARSRVNSKPSERTRRRVVFEPISALRGTARRNCCLRASRARRPARPLRHERDGRRPSVPPPWRSRR